MGKDITTIIKKDVGYLKLTWIPTQDIEKYFPVRQAYAVCFKDPSSVLLINENNKWKIPGGTPEESETILQTLTRELHEEADIEVDRIIPIGVQKVEVIDNPNTGDLQTYYQYRYICRISKINAQTVDPAKGVILPRKFYKTARVKQLVSWGAVGDAMFDSAFSQSNKLFL